MILWKKDNRSDKSNPSCTLYTIGRFTFFWKTLNSHKKKIYKGEKKEKTIKRNILVGIRETKRSEKECGSNDQLIRHLLMHAVIYIVIQYEAKRESQSTY